MLHTVVACGSFGEVIGSCCARKYLKLHATLQNTDCENAMLSLAPLGLDRAAVRIDQEAFRDLWKRSRFSSRTVIYLIGLKLFGSVIELFALATLIPILGYIQKASEDSAGGGVDRVSEFYIGFFAWLGIDYTPLAMLCAFAVLVTTKQVFSYAFRVVYIGALQNVIANIRTNITASVFAADIQFHEANSPGQICSDAIVEPPKASAILFAPINAASNAFTIGVYLVGIVYAVGPIALLAFVPAALLGILLKKLIENTRAESEKQTIAIRELSGAYVSKLQSIRLIKIASTAELEKAKIGDLVDSARASAGRIATLQARVPLIVEPVGATLIVLAIYGGATLLELPLNLVLVLIAAFIRLLPVIQDVAKSVQLFVGAIASARMLSARIAASDAVAEMPGGDLLFPDMLKCGIEFCDVSYSFPNGRLALDRVNATVEAGKISAIVGPSGAGKSTLIDLLPVLRQPQSGEVLVDRIPLNRFSVSSIRSKIAYVPQFPDILPGTLRDHIGYGNPPISDGEFVKLVELVGLKSVMENSPKGIDSLLGEGGVGLSGGQRQRLDLARAVAGRKPIIILDEPASGLDPESEKELSAALRCVQQLNGTTIILVSHREEGVATADRVILMNNGAVVAQGSQRELSAGNDWFERAFGNAK